MGNADITANGIVGAIRELRFFPDGTASLGVRLAVTPSKKNRETGEWSDAPTMWFDVSFRGNAAEQVVEHVNVGDALVVSGELRRDEYTTKAGESGEAWTVLARRWGVTPKRERARAAGVAGEAPW